MNRLVSMTIFFQKSACSALNYISLLSNDNQMIKAVAQIMLEITYGHSHLHTQSYKK